MCFNIIKQEDKIGSECNETRQSWRTKYLEVDWSKLEWETYRYLKILKRLFLKMHDGG